MDCRELEEWLVNHADEILRFTDYEVTPSSDENLDESLGQTWFRDDDWNQPGYRFILLGHDGTGGTVAAWLRPQHPETTSVVFFGSEGGAGVLTSSALAFAQALAHGPLIEEYQKPDLDAPSRLSLEDNWYFSHDDPEWVAEATEALANYRRSTEARFGVLPSFEALVEVPVALQAEFRTWVCTIQARASERDTRAEQLATDLKHKQMRVSALRYALLSAATLPVNSRSAKDGTRFTGCCAPCGEHDELRLTRFDEFVFGLCLRCYFSAAW